MGLGRPVVARPRRVVGRLVHAIIRSQRSSDTVAGVDTAVDIAVGFMTAFAGGDPDVIAAMVTDDFRNEHLSELGTGCVGRDQYRARLDGFLATFVGATYAIETAGELLRPGDSLPSEHQVVVRYRFRAEFEGTPIDIPGVMWLEVRAGSIARRIDLWDSLTFLRQTGQAV